MSVSVLIEAVEVDGSGGGGGPLPGQVIKHRRPLSSQHLKYWQGMHESGEHSGGVSHSLEPGTPPGERQRITVTQTK
jgi:hypothetical protein